MKKTIIFLVLATLCQIPKLQAQLPAQLTGQVRSSNNQILKGATITITGSTLKTITDENGNFSFTTAPPKGTITVSYTGYLSRNIPFNTENRSLKISLENKDNTLQDVQINAGYYKVKDRERTGTITKVSAATIANQPVSNPIATLQGRVAGLVIIQRNGLPGSDFSVQLRGRSSIQSGTSPLYLIDGVPFPSETLAQNSPIFANSPLNSISPSDIESIEVLKDADATAIYGSRGANGVILITTKKGKTGNLSAQVEITAGMGQVTRVPELMNTEEYLQMRKQAFINDKVSPTNANAPDLLLWDNNRYQNFPDLITGGTAQTQSAQLRLSGGSQNTNYTFGANYYHETTAFPGDNGLKRKDASLNLQHRSSDNRFNLNVSGSYGSSVNNLYATDLTSAIAAVPNGPYVYDGLGKLVWADQGISFTNPLAGTLRTNTFRAERFNGNAVMGYRTLSGLEAKVAAGINSAALNQYSATPIVAQNPASSPTGFASSGNNLNQGWTVEPQLDYSLGLKQYGKISMLIGATWQGNTSRSNFTSASGYTNDLLIGSLEAAASKEPSNAFSEYRYQALFARINYNLQGRYLVNLTGRRDGSSRFGPGRQFANFGAIGAAWIFSSENFVNTTLPFLSFGKLRASYGITGNDQINNYQYLDSYVPTETYGGQTGLIPTKLFNESYGWEANTKLEANLELGFLHDRIRFSAGWYRNVSGNQLISYSLPGQTGFPSILRNLDARVENHGLELELNTVNIKSRNFTWSTSANLTLARNRLLEFPGLATSSYASTYFIGEPLNTLQGYRYTGISQATGAYTFEDRNGDKLINSLDYYHLGTTDPVFYGGISNTLQYKGFSLELFFQFARQQGNDLAYGSNTLVGSRSNVPKILLDSWTPENPGAKYQAYSQANSGAVNTARSLIRTSDAALVDASFIRLKNLALSYNLPQALIKRIHLQGARVSLRGQNLLTFTPYEGLDPESQNFTSLPPLRMLSLGLQLTL